MARQDQRPLRDLGVLLYGAGLGFLTNLATDDAEKWPSPFNLVHDGALPLFVAGTVVPVGYYAWRHRRLRLEHEWNKGNPYPGLQAFGPEHETVFFGRDKAIRDLYERLDGPGDRFVLVAGPSGSGKSSLVNSGLARQLRRRHWTVLGPMTPGRDPFGALCRTFWGERAASAEGDDLVRDLRTDAARALDRLRREESAEPSAVVDALVRPRSGHRPMVLLLDQAEELVTQVDDQTRREFMALLHSALAGHRRLHVVATMRTEFIGEFQQEPSGILLGDPYLVRPLRRQDLRQVITGPARKAGVDIDSEAVAEILNDATRTDSDVLPLLAHLLHHLYERYAEDGDLTLAEYEDFGRVEKAISTTADKVLGRLERLHDKEKVLRTLLRFVSWAPNAEDPTRRRVRVADLAEDEQAIVAAFLDARLLVESAEGERDLAHEALLRQWEPLRERLEEQRPLLRQRTILEQRAQEWEQSGRKADRLLAESQVAEAEAVVEALDCSEALEEFCAASQKTASRNRRIRAIDAARQADAFRTDEPELALALAREAAELVPDRSTAVSLLARLQNPVVRSLRRHADTVFAVCADAEGRLHAVDGTGMVFVHDQNSDQPAAIRRIPGVERITAAAWAGPRSLAFGSPSGDVGFWNLDEGETRKCHTHGDYVRAVAWSPSGALASGGDDKAVRVWDPSSSEVRVVDRHADWVRSVAWSPDGQLLASCADDGAVRVWYAESDETVLVQTHSGVATSVAWSPDGLLASSGDDRTLQVWNRTDRTTRVLSTERDQTLTVAWSPGGRLACATGFRNGTIRVWDSNLERSVALRQPSPSTSMLTWQDGERLVVGFYGGAVDVLMPRLRPTAGRAEQPAPVTAGVVAGTELLTLGGDGRVRVAGPSVQQAGLVSEDRHSGRVDEFAWSNSGLLASRSGVSGEVWVWDSATGSSWEVHQQEGGSFSWSPDGLLASYGDRGALVVVNPRTGESFPVDAGRVEGVAWSADGLLAIGNQDGEVRVWDPDNTSGITQVVCRHADWVRAVAWGASGALASVGDDGNVRVSHPDSGHSELIYSHEGWVRSVAWSSDGWLASIGDDDKVRVWDGRGVEVVLDGKGEDVSWSPDGLLAFAGHNGEVWVWDQRTREARQVHEHRYPVDSLAWSASGELVSASAGRDGMVLIWDSRQDRNRKLAATERHTLLVTWSPTGELTTADSDNRIRIWDRELAGHRTLRPHGGGGPAIAVSPRGRIATCGDDGEILVWDRASGRSEVVARQATDVSAMTWVNERLVHPGGNALDLEVLNPDDGTSTTLTGATGPLHCIAWDGRSLLAAGGADFVVRLWDLGTMRMRELRRHRATIRALEWWGERRLISAGDDGLFVWDVPTGEVVMTGDAVRVSLLALAPGSLLATADDDEGNIRFWDLETGHVVATIPAHDGRITALGWRDDGRLVSAGADRQILTWHLDTDADALLAEAEQRGVRRLTEQERGRFGL
ncbi:AAA family ATPase [Saccharopolyspora taberi]|uniref:Novel STAND NTPase 1 domain-containing protein n=1 Tax=Saccharopolyspora taberi TaxID=60895 RepID=A0ABN3V7F2_9PSEU